MSAGSVVHESSKQATQSCDEGWGGEGERPSSPSSSSVPVAQPKYVTVKEATAMVGLSAGTLKRAIKAGKLRAFKPGGKLLVRPEDLQEWVEARPVNADPMPAPNRPVQTTRLIDQVLARQVDSV